MKITITQKGYYSDSNGKRIWLTVGEVMDYPQWYAQSLVDSSLAVVGDTSLNQTQSLSAIDEMIADTEADPKAETSEKIWDDGIQATSAALNFAVQHEVDLQQVEGTGKGGKITLSDVKRVFDG